MKILVLGASGRTGRLVVTQALDAGHLVTALVRDPDALSGALRARPSLRVAVGDALLADDVDVAVAGQDAVVVALGTSPRERARVRSAGTANVVAAMRRHGVRRVVVQSAAITGDGVRGVHGPARLVVRLVKLANRRTFADQARQEAVVRASDLEWVLARPITLTDDPARGAFRIAPRLAVGPSSRIARADVAAFMLAQATDPDWLGQAPSLAY